MNGKDLKAGMVVTNGDCVIKVTHVPALDKYGECFFSGEVLESKGAFYKDDIGKEFKDNWNSHFFRKM